MSKNAKVRIFFMKFDSILMSTLKSLAVHTSSLLGDSISLPFTEHWLSVIIVLSAVHVFFCVILTTTQWVRIIRATFQMRKLKTREVK